MSTVTTSIDSTTGGVKISWTAPADGSSTITSYSIEIKEKGTSTYTADLTDCNGANALVMTNRYCVIPMSTLTSTYAYIFDDLVVVRAKAVNAKGSGSYSDDNSSGAKIRSIPITMTTLAVSDYSDTYITLTWTALSSPDTGNSDIITYNIQYNNDQSGTYSNLISTSSTTYTFSPAVGGTHYRF
jgi:hypothetical protein